MLLHSLRTGICVRKLLIFPSPPSLMAISKAGLIAIHSSADPKKVCVFSLNGFPVSSPIVTLSKPFSLLFTHQGDHLLIGSEDAIIVIPVFATISTQIHAFPQDPLYKSAICSLFSSEDAVLRVTTALQPRRELRERQWTVCAEVLRWTGNREEAQKQRMLHVFGTARRQRSGLLEKVSPSRV